MSNLDRIHDFRVLATNGSDHFPICIELSDEIIPYNKQIGTRLKWNPDLEKTYQAVINKKMHADPDKNLQQTIKETATDLKMITKGIPPGFKPWFDHECQETRKILRQLQRQAKSENWRPPYKDYYVKVSRLHQKQIKDKKKAFKEAQLISLREANTTQKFWQEMRKFRRPQFVPNGITEDEWKAFYNSQMPPREPLPQLDFIHSDSNLDEPFTEGNILAVTKRSSNNKAPGPDGITNEFWKYLPPKAISKLTVEFNEVLESGRIPEEWLTSETVMLHKKGSVDDPSNFRPIALASTAMKLFTAALADRLSNWAEGNEILPEAQGGFRRSRSCQEQIFNLTGALHIHLRRPGRRAYALFVDFQRAFPSIPHNKLWHRLANLGVGPKVLQVLMNLYYKTQTTIRLPDRRTQPIDVTLGLLQGDLLSPLLFSLYIHDIERQLRRCGALGLALTKEDSLHVLLFADDTVVLAPTKGAMREKIKVLQKYFRELDLVVNLAKTKIVVFRKGGRLESDLVLKYNDELIEIVSEYVYLGVNMSSSTIFAKQADRAERKTNQVVQQILSLTHRTKISSFHSHYTLFESVIKPTLLYASPVWAHRYKLSLEPVQNNYYRRVLNLAPTLHTAIIRRETASNTLEFSIWQQTINFLCKVKHMRPSRYAFIIFNRLVQLDNEARAGTGRKNQRNGNMQTEYNWVTQIRQGLRPMGLDGVVTMLPEDVSKNYDQIIQIIDQHFKDQDAYALQTSNKYPQYASLLEFQQQNSQTQHSDDDPQYASLQESQQQNSQIQQSNDDKQEKSKRWHKLPTYLQADSSLHTKKLVAQLRQNSMWMRIKADIVRIPHESEEKICSLCNLNAVDNCIHTLLHCPVTKISAQLLTEWQWNDDNYYEKIEELSTTEGWEDVILQALKTRIFATTEPQPI